MDLAELWSEPHVRSTNHMRSRDTSRRSRPSPQDDEKAVFASNHTIRVVLADDHRILRQGLAMLLNEEPGIEVVGEAPDGQSAVDMARTLHPDVIIMDISMPRLSGVEATRLISRQFPDIRIIALSMYDDAHMSAAMRDAGAVAYFTKGGPSERLVDAIRESSAA